MANGAKRLHFPCSCVSGGPNGYSDPWADIARHKLLPKGTKEEIVNLVAKEPMTISQLAQALGLSAPSVHTHVTDMIRSELIRESREWEKRYPTERYYEPNFPVLKAADCVELFGMYEEVAEKVAALFEEKAPQLQSAFESTDLSHQGWTFTDITLCVFTNMQRSARKRLEEVGLLKGAEKHANGTEWIFWAEEPKDHTQPE